MSQRCSRCRADRLLLVRIREEELCAACWRRAGMPGPGVTATAAEVFIHETKVRERMTARGGTDRHLVRNGMA